MKLDQGHGVVIKGPDGDLYKKLADYLLILYKLEFDKQDILDFVEKTLNGYPE